MQVKVNSNGILNQNLEIQMLTKEEMHSNTKQLFVMKNNIRLKQLKNPIKVKRLKNLKTDY